MRTSKDISKETEQQLIAAIKEYKEIFVAQAAGV
jgi:hypothetical protein